MDEGQKQIKIGSIMAYVGLILQIFTAILTTPYIVDRIGNSAYGVYKAIASFVSYMTILNFGLGTAALRYLSEYRVTNDKNKEKELLAFIQKINFIISVMVLVIGVFILAFIPKLFGRAMSPEEINLACRLFVILLINIIVSIYTDKYAGIINAYEKFAFIKLCDAARSLSKIILIFAILSASRSAVALTLIDLGLNLTTMICDRLYCGKRLKIYFGESIPLRKINWKQYKEFLFYSGGIFTATIINQLLWNVDSVIIGARLGAVDSAVYAVGTTFSSAFFNASIVITNMLLPKIVRMTEYGATGKEYTEFTIKIARIQSCVILYMYAAFVVFGQKFIYLWMGADYEQAWTTALMVMTGALFSLFVSTVKSILRALKKQKFDNTVHLIMFSLNAVFTYFAVGKLGINGAALMTLLTYLCGYVFILYPYYQVKIHVNIIKVFGSLLKRCIPIAVFSGVSCRLFSRNFGNTWPALVIEGVIFTVIYVSGIYITMNKYEKNIVNSTVKGFFNARKK